MNLDDLSVRIYLDKQSLGATSAKATRAKGMIDEMLSDLASSRASRFNR